MIHCFFEEYEEGKNKKSIKMKNGRFGYMRVSSRDQEERVFF